MPYISADALQQARRIDLLSYLQTNDPEISFGSPVTITVPESMIP